MCDLTSAFGVMAVGHAHPRIVDAVASQARVLLHAMSEIDPHAYEAAAVERIASRVGIQDAQVVLTSSGSEAVEVAMKIAYLRTARPGVLVMEAAYHGQSLGALRGMAQESLAAPLREIVEGSCQCVPFPGRQGVPSNEVLGLVRRLLLSGGMGGRSIGAVIVEPMQNFGGYRLLQPEFASGLRDICTEAGVLLVADEVFTGFGRCGSWVLSTEIGLAPDVVCVGKSMTGGVPGGACVAPRGLVDHLRTASGATVHGPTFFANPLQCAATSATIDVLESEELLGRSREIEKRMRAALRALVERDAVAEIRGRGAAIGVHLLEAAGRSGGQRAISVVALARRAGVLCLNSGFPAGDVITLCPPLTIEFDLLEDAVGRVVEAIRVTAEPHGR